MTSAASKKMVVARGRGRLCWPQNFASHHLFSSFAKAACTRDFARHQPEWHTVDLASSLRNVMFLLQLTQERPRWTVNCSRLFYIFLFVFDKLCVNFYPYATLVIVVVSTCTWLCICESLLSRWLFLCAFFAKFILFGPRFKTNFFVALHKSICRTYM